MKKEKIIPAWVHNPGHHCGSTALSDVFTFYGMPLSEPMCFGLGSGLGFHYVEMEGLNPSRFFHLRSYDLELNCLSFFKIPFEWKKVHDPEDALDLAKQAIDRDHPVILRTDIYHLGYYKSSTHFSGHLVLLWGYNDDEGVAYISDTGWPGLQTVTYEELKQARASKTPPIPLDNEYFELVISNSENPLKEAIPQALRLNAATMLENEKTEGVFYHRGVEGMKVLSERLPTWQNAEDWKWCTRFAYQIIEKRGTGGSAFRVLYRDFLREAEQLLPELQTHHLADRMTAITELWTELASQFKEASEADPPQDLSGAIQTLDKLQCEENDFYRDVLEIFPEKPEAPEG